MSVYTQRIEEQPVHRLGRHVEHDPRSLNHPFEAPRDIVVRTITHGRAGTIFDQGQLGSCTGNAVAGACNTRPTYNAQKHPVLTEQNAVALYELATQLDSFPGAYPPDDTGSSGLAACKAAVKLGWITAYKWTFNITDLVAALMVRPVCVGVNWYESFDRPAVDGRVGIAGGVRGGHEFVIRGYDAGQRLLWADNSWGSGWGKSGRFCFTVDTMDRLLGEHGDCVVPVR